MAQLPGSALELVRGDDLPIGTNLFWRLQALIRSGRLAADQRLPGIREFATGAGVNVNTARAIYRRLEDDGLAVSRQGLGTFVSSHAPVSPPLEELAARVAAEATALGIEPRELARAVYAGSSAGSGLEGPATTLRTDQEERSAREALRGQIARLESRLAAYPESRSSEGAAPEHAAPRIATLDELEAARDDLLGQLERAQQAAEERGARQAVARRWREAALADPSSHRWESISNEDLGEPGCGVVAVRPRWGPVGALADWWRVKISSGCP